MFLEVNEAYEPPSNPLLRREYDERTAAMRGEMPYRPPQWPGSPRKVRMPESYVRVSPPFTGYRDRMETVRDRSMARRTHAAKLIWRAYVVTVVSMSGTLGVYGGDLLSMGMGVSGGGAPGGGPGVVSPPPLSPVVRKGVGPARGPGSGRRGAPPTPGRR